ncbi:hypothetical protein PACTADRAFT_5171 [Pachysolen tannophilus NRRL Y-2460]|uniref:t-SNARE coiled-coil homology domain-containing protein n=1 Tax=Pachysolen tannophilus NRRL Y-2460 TaxID=669874 RepID=A0A1E4TNY5_PACTA|nr:hypothetical protein PACTADRAFT_5171 [Pachysolen tannophilus NRRL Y-2460]
MSSSRYSSQLHQRDQTRTSLFSTTSNNGGGGGSSSNNISKSNNVLATETDLPRSSSPYSTPSGQKDYSSSLMDQLESQNNVEINEMTEKVKLLKNIGLKMNTELNSSSINIKSLNENFEKMLPVVKRYGTRVGVIGRDGWFTFKGWLIFFGLVFLIFFIRWIF